MSDQPPRIALIIDHLDSGGAQRQLVELATALQASGRADVRVAVYDSPDFFASQLEQAGIPLTTVRKTHRFDPLFPMRLARWIRESGVDIVHAFLRRPQFWTQLALRSIPKASRPAFIAAERNTFPRFTTAESLWLRAGYSIADVITTNAQDARRDILDHFGLPANKVVYIPNGIDLERWDRAGREPSPLPPTDRPFQLVLPSGFRPEKNHILLLEALQQIAPDKLAQLKIWFLGGHTSEDCFTQRVRDEITARKLGHVVQIHPPVRNVAAAFAGIDGIVLPSSFEGFPNVVLEALASRRPVIASRVGDVETILEGGEAGILVDPNDVAQMSNAILQFFGLSAESRAAMGRKGRNIVEQRYTLQNTTRQNLDLYRAILRQRGGVQNA